MKKMNFDIAINAPREKVWQTLWNLNTYQQWTAPFNPDPAAQPGSTVETDNWKEGTVVKFLGDENNGMLSFIEKKVDNEYMSFRHDGQIINGVEDTTSEQAKSFAGAHENYTLKDENGGTHVYIEMDSDGGEFEAMFKEMWPKALQKLKEISEHK